MTDHTFDSPREPDGRELSFEESMQASWGDGALPVAQVDVERHSSAVDSRAEERAIGEYSLYQDGAEYLGQEFLDLIERQLPPGMTIKNSKILGVNRGGVEGDGCTYLGVSFELREDGSSRYIIPDPAFFEPQEDLEGSSKETTDEDPSPIQYEVEDADPDNPDAPRIVRERSTQKSDDRKHTAVLSILDGNMEEVFEPVDTHARIIFVSNGEKIAIQVVFRDVEEVPDSLLVRLLETSPQQVFNHSPFGDPGSDTAASIFQRLITEGKPVEEIVPVLQSSGFDMDDIAPLLSMKRPSGVPEQKPEIDVNDFPVLEGNSPFSFGRIALHLWGDGYLERLVGEVLPGESPTIRAITPLGRDGGSFEVALEIPSRIYGTNPDIHKVELHPYLKDGILTFQQMDQSVLSFRAYVDEAEKNQGD